MAPLRDEELSLEYGDEIALDIIAGRAHMRRIKIVGLMIDWFVVIACTICGILDLTSFWPLSILLFMSALVNVPPLKNFFKDNPKIKDFIYSISLFFCIGITVGHFYLK